jgi:hypothetical protein
MWRPKRSPKTAETALETGAKALLFLAKDEQRLARFLNESGLDPSTLQKEAHAPHMLSAVLAHLLGDEPLLLVFTAESGLDPADVTRAQMMLDGEL